jgi:hypothetical protein
MPRLRRGVAIHIEYALHDTVSVSRVVPRAADDDSQAPTPLDRSFFALAVDRPSAARVASDSGRRATLRHSSIHIQDARRPLDINDDAKEIVKELGTAINAAVERSTEVAEAIERLRDAGYEMELTLRLEIGLRARDGEEADDPAQLELTDEDRRTLRNMRIRFDDGE